MKVNILIFLAATSTFNFTKAENILFFFASGSWSHKVSIWPLAMALADRGHNVTFLSGHAKQPFEHPKVHDLLSPTIQTKLKSIYGVDRFLERLNSKELDLWSYNNIETVKTCELIFNAVGDPALDYVLHEGQFDLVVTNLVLGDCGLLVAHQKKAKLIISASTPLLTWLYDEFGFPDEPTTVPDMTPEYTYPMGFWDRLHNYLTPIIWYLKRHYEIYGPLEAIMAKGYNLKPEEVPSLLDVQRNASLILLSSHYSTDFARSLPPMVVNIGGMQCWQPKKPLTGEFKDIMDNAKNGVILIAFGSTINLASMPLHMKNNFFDMMRQLPGLTFIWRWDGPAPENPPENLIISKWLPQVQILAHPNCKGFISHAGLNSITEATYNGVPIILLPLFADQDYNAYRIEASEIGIRLEFRGLTTADLVGAVKRILTDPKYKKNMEIMSGTLKDRPMSPIETGVYWTEFVLRHENTKALKPLQYLPWYKRRQLDVLFILFAGVTGVFLLVLALALYAVKRIMSSRSPTITVVQNDKKRK